MEWGTRTTRGAGRTRSRPKVSSPPCDYKGAAKRPSLMGLARDSPVSASPWVQRQYGVLERAPRGTLTRRHGAGFPQWPRRGWRDTAPRPA